MRTGRTLNSSTLQLRTLEPSLPTPFGVDNIAPTSSTPHENPLFELRTTKPVRIPKFNRADHTATRPLALIDNGVDGPGVIPRSAGIPNGRRPRDLSAGVAKHRQLYLGLCTSALWHSESPTRHLWRLLRASVSHIESPSRARCIFCVLQVACGSVARILC